MDREDIMGTSSPELKQLWIRVLKRVHPDLAIDEQDRIRCERLTQLANEAYQAGDMEALRAVLAPQPSTDLPPTAAFPWKRSLSVGIALTTLICGGISLYSITASQHALASGPASQPDPVKVSMKTGAPSEW